MKFGIWGTQKKSASNKYAISYWVALFFIIFVFHYNNPLNPDEGVILEGAWNLVNNRKIYIDFFEFTPPGSFYLVLTIWKILGINYFRTKIITIIILFISAIGIYKISSLLHDNYTNFLAPLLFILSSSYWPLINHNFLSTSIIIWAIYLIIYGLTTESKKKYNIYFIYSGIICGISILFLHTKGVVFFLATFSFLLINSLLSKEKYSTLNSIYFLAATLVPVFLLFVTWPTKLLYTNLILFPLNNYIEVNRISFDILSIFLILLFIECVIKLKNKYITIRYLLFIQFILLLSTISRPDHYHISLIIFPFYILLESKINISKRTIHITTVQIISIFILLIYPSVINFYHELPIFYNMSNVIVTEINKYCNDSPYIYAGPFLPGLYFESRKLNPSPYSHIITNMHTEEAFNTTRDSLERFKPSCAVIDYNAVIAFKYDKENVVDNYIRNNYEPIVKINDLSIYRYTTAPH